MVLAWLVSLEAIFLSTFVMISQNRADAKRQLIALEEDRQNQELLDLSRQILELTKAIHAVTDRRRAPE